MKQQTRIQRKPVPESGETQPTAKRSSRLFRRIGIASLFAVSTTTAFSVLETENETQEIRQQQCYYFDLDSDEKHTKYIGNIDTLLFFDDEEKETLISLIKLTEDPNEALMHVIEHVGNNGIRLNIGVPEGVTVEGGTGELKNDYLINLVSALSILPTDLVQSSGIQDIYLSPQLIFPDIVDTTEGTGVLLSRASGAFDHSNNTLMISYDGLISDEAARSMIVHEVIGHGVLEKLCNPYLDEQLKELNESVVPGFQYKKAYQQTTVQKLFYNSGIVTVNAYAASSPSEDMATIADKLFNNPKIYDPTDLSVVDEKIKLARLRLAEIFEPIDEVIAYTLQQ